MSDEKDQPTLFFNYHEYAVSQYQESTMYGLGPLRENARKLIVTHFPNPYISRGSTEFEATRIVRVPRTAEVEGDRFPQFSTVLPGSEPGAYKGTEFVTRGVVDGQCFGYSSVSPLSLYLTQPQFEDIVAKTNELLKSAYDPVSWATWLWNAFDTATFYVFSHIRLFPSPDVGALEKLERYVNEVNEKLTQDGVPVQLCSPRRSGCLSLDFQVPRPTL